MHSGSHRVPRGVARSVDLAILAMFLGAIGWIGPSSQRMAQASGEDGPPSLPREFRGVWVATVDNIDWPSQRGLDATRLRDELARIVRMASDLRLNAIVFQVRPACDAIYASKLEPWSAYVSGTQGVAPDGDIDPLAELIELAHGQGLEVHAWFNPYRARHAAFRGELAANHVNQTHPNWVRSYGGYLWLDPGEPAATAHSLAVIRDVVDRYDLDGVHVDDYFYPYPVMANGKEVPFPDDATYAARPAALQDLSVEDWRRHNVNEFVRRMYEETRQAKPWVKVGVSPFGIWRPGHPEGIRGFDAHAKLYADAVHWFQKGWVDYLAPQLYWKIDAPEQSYPVLLKWWHEQNSNKRHLWPGNFTSRLGDASQKWSVDEVVRQIELTRQQEGGGGNIHFSMKAFLQDYQGIANKVAAGVYAERALVPASPWISEAEPTPASVRPRAAGTPDVASTDQPKIDWEFQAANTLNGPEAVRWWLVQYRAEAGWQSKLVPAQRRGLSSSELFGGDRPKVFFVSPISRTGIQGRVTRVPVK